ncbi:MAG: hypothetical protein CMQ15_04650 [Gammaproteobacteria bacterium]|nr:hypothetical protein [Gammaproteobacteria bacterium]
MYPILISELATCVAEPSDTRTIVDGTVCLEPRPQICTLDYRPVCGIIADGSRQEFSNGCGACSVPEVVSFVENTCETAN